MIIHQWHSSMIERVVMLEDLDSTQCNIISDVPGYGGTCLPGWSKWISVVTFVNGCQATATRTDIVI